MYRLVFLIFVASASAYITRDSECPKFKSMDNFNFKSFGEGVWFEHGRYPDDVVKDGKCGILKYKQDGDVKKVMYTVVNNHKPMSFEGTIKFANDAEPTGKLIHNLPFGANGTNVDIDLNILTVDYDNFFISYYCQFDEVKKSYREASWIFSRSKTLSEEAKATVDKFVKDSQFLNADKYVWPSVSDEDCLFGEGVWFEHGRYPDDVVKDGKCGILKYKQDGDVKKVMYTVVNNHKPMSFEGTIKFANDAEPTGKLIHNLPFGANGTNVDIDLNILTVDYDNFFISYYCQFDEVKKSYREASWIFSRSKTLSEEAKATVDKFVKDSQFLNADKYVWPSVSDEDCLVNA